MSRLLNEWIASPNRLCGRRQRCTVRPLTSTTMRRQTSSNASASSTVRRWRGALCGDSCGRSALSETPCFDSREQLCIDQREAPSGYTSAPCSIHGSAVHRSTGSTVRLPATRPTPCFDSPGTLCVDQRRDAVLNGVRNPALERGRGRASMA